MVLKMQLIIHFSFAVNSLNIFCELMSSFPFIYVMPHSSSGLGAEVSRGGCLACCIYTQVHQMNIIPLKWSAYSCGLHQRAAGR